MTDLSTVAPIGEKALAFLKGVDSPTIANAIEAFKVRDRTDGFIGGEVRALFPRIRRHPVDKAEGEFPTEVHVLLADGRSFATSVAWPAGSIAAPFTLDQHWAKFDGCAAGLLPPDSHEAVREALANLAVLPSIASLMVPLRGSPR